MATDDDTGEQAPALFEDLHTPEMEMPTTFPPKLAAGLVKAQVAATTVENDGWNSYDKYKYPTQAAIASKARDACKAGGLAILMFGWTTFRDDDGRMRLRVPVNVVHESGECIPTFYAEMPVIPNPKRPNAVDKAMAATLSLLRKYVTGQLLNMGWNDEGEDVEQREESREPVPQPRNRVTAKPAAPKPQPKPKPAGIPEGILDRARAAMQMLKDRFEFASTGIIYATATGRKAEWPGEPDILDFMGVVQLAALCEASDSEGADIPMTHGDFLSQGAAQSNPLYDPYFAQGEHTEAGKKALADFREAQTQATDG